MTLLCPICRHPIDAAACDPKSDRAPCPACGRDWSYEKTEIFSSFAAKAHGPVPKRFAVAREGTGDDSRLTIAYRPGYPSYYVLLTLAVLLGAVALAGVGYACLRGGAVAWPLVAFAGILSLFLLKVAREQGGVREFTFARGKGTYRKNSFWKGRLRGFEYDSSFAIAWREPPVLWGESPVVVLDHFDSGGRCVMLLRQAFRREDVDFFQSVVLDALPVSPDEIKPAGEHVETPEEAAARRVYEAVAADEERRARSPWRRFGWVVVFIAFVGVRLGYRSYEKAIPRHAGEHLAQVVNTFEQRGDYTAVASRPPWRAGLSYRRKVLPPIVHELDGLKELLTRHAAAKKSGDVAELGRIRIEALREKLRLESETDWVSSGLKQFFMEHYRNLMEK